jgi:hypothetical protein
MKKRIGFLVSMLLLVMVFTSCESKSGQRYRESKERAEIGATTKTDTNIKVEVISESKAILVDNNVQKFKVKVMYADSMVCFALLDNKFEIGDKIEIKPTQRIGN